jgi:hypothetical protein
MAREEGVGADAGTEIVVVLFRCKMADTLGSKNDYQDTTH